MVKKERRRRRREEEEHVVKERNEEIVSTGRMILLDQWLSDKTYSSKKMNTIADKTSTTTTTVRRPRNDSFARRMSTAPTLPRTISRQSPRRQRPRTAGPYRERKTNRMRYSNTVAFSDDDKTATAANDDNILPIWLTKGHSTPIFRQDIREVIETHRGLEEYFRKVGRKPVLSERCELDRYIDRSALKQNQTKPTHREKINEKKTPGRRPRPTIRTKNHPREKNRRLKNMLKDIVRDTPAEKD